MTAQLDSRALDPRARPGAAASLIPAADVISDVLHAVRLRGAVYFSVKAAAPWVVEAPPSAELAAHLVPGAEHVMEYHAVISGSCWGGLIGEPAERLGAGDIVIFPRGDAHVMSSQPGMRGPRDLPHRQRAMFEPLPIRLDSTHDAEPTVELVCGFLACDTHPFNPLLSALPRMLVVRPAGSRTDALLALLLQRALGESRFPSSGGGVMLARLGELMLFEGIRQHLASHQGTPAGWLSGLRDPIVGRAIVAMHERPAHDWTLESLARHAGASRSVLAQRFTQSVGVPPMLYLTQWRMQLAANLIAAGATLAHVASEVGYGSEPALSRAFKKVVGLAPAEWRASRIEDDRSRRADER